MALKNYYQSVEKWENYYNRIYDFIESGRCFVLAEWIREADYFDTHILKSCGYCTEFASGKSSNENCVRCPLFLYHCSTRCENDASSTIFWRIRSNIRFCLIADMNSEYTLEILVMAKEMLKAVKKYKHKF